MYAIQQTETLDAAAQAALLKLWNDEFIVSIAHPNLESLQAYLASLQNIRYLLLTDEDEQLAGIAFSFDRDGARWFSILLSDAAQGRGYGRALMERLMALEPELNGWVIDRETFMKANGQNYGSPLAFYERLGFVVKPEDRIDNEKIAAVRIWWKAAKEHP